MELWDGDDDEPRHVIINTEWGAFGANGELDFIRTKWDMAGIRTRWEGNQQPGIKRKRQENSLEGGFFNDNIPMCTFI